MKVQSKDKQTEFPCFECEEGMMKVVYEDFETEVPELGKITVPNVIMHRCDHCDCSVIGDEGGEMIDAYLDKITEVITPKEIQTFLDKYNINQKEAAEITGYGEKNISRWLRGHMRPSKSVSNNLRTLLASSEAFEILKNRNWNSGYISKVKIEERQPDKEEKKILSFLDYKSIADLGLVKGSRSPKEKRSEICRLLGKATLQDGEAELLNSFGQMAAYQDTNQEVNSISAGMWCWLGEQAAAGISVEPYNRDKLALAVESLRQYTQYDEIVSVIPDVTEILRKAGVALVFVPIMKQSALRGCTKLVSPAKAMIVHGLKYRNHAQFWRILFHEIAHLMLHLDKSGEFIADYENQKEDQREQEADQWANHKLVESSELMRFSARHRKPEFWDIVNFAKRIHTHPAIVAEIFNEERGREIIKFSLLQNKGLFPRIAEEDVKKLGRDSASKILERRN